MFTTLAVSKAGLYALAGRRLHESGFLPSIVWAALAIGLPYFAVLAGSVMTQDGMSDTKKEECCEQAKVAAIIAAVAGLLTFYMGQEIFTVAFVSMCGSILGLCRRFEISWGKSFAAMGGFILASIIMEQIVLAIFA